MTELINKILSEYEKGNIVIATIEGLQGMKLSDFIDQPVDGMLYDLNRDEATVLTLINNPKWINDYAVCKVIRALKDKIDELKADIEVLRQSGKTGDISFVSNLDKAIMCLEADQTTSESVDLKRDKLIEAKSIIAEILTHCR